MTAARNNVFTHSFILSPLNMKTLLLPSIDEMSGWQEYRQKGLVAAVMVLSFLALLGLMNQNPLLVATTRTYQRVVQQDPLQKEFQNVSVIITSSLIPNHPNIDIIQQTIQSLSHLQHLPLDVPIYVTVDGLPSDDLRRQAKKLPFTEQDKARLAAYIGRMQDASFEPYTNVKLLVAPKHLHIAGSVHWAITEFVQTQFVYVLQHDLAFGADIDHYHLLQAMSNSTHIPWLRNVRFRLGKVDRIRFPPCKYLGKGKNIKLEYGLKVFATAKWSDNNQVSTREYYLELFEKLHFLQRPMEGAMMVASKENCSYWGQVVYGGLYDKRPYLVHLDGRHSDSFNSSNMELGT
eukprot:Nitzschia sp. Nitz4//scaffold265_size26576//7713//8792//NITZ4_008246-RA/size26576-processed-gene-0.33-mRNA-1//-1//CDS//3329544834//4167//frame0